MDTPIYEERQTTYLRPVWVAAIIAVMAFAAWQTWTTEQNVLATMAILIIAAIASLAVWSLTEIRVVITPVELRFGPSVFTKRFSLSQIRVGDVIHIPFFAGFGIHYYMGTWVFNARYGRGLNISVGNRRYLIGSNQPERLQSALMQVVPRRDPR